MNKGGLAIATMASPPSISAGCPNPQTLTTGQGLSRIIS